jgi:hypothetical protein
MNIFQLITLNYYVWCFIVIMLLPLILICVIVSVIHKTTNHLVFEIKVAWRLLCKISMSRSNYRTVYKKFHKKKKDV